MKRLACEMCGGTDIVKQDGLFVCQVCGCKYTLEEARKMMVEGTVEVQGTVQIDNSSYVEKYLQNARRAKSKEDWEETEKYYNLVEQNDPTNIEAIFYSAYGKAKQALIPTDFYAREAAFRVLNNSVSVIDDHYDPNHAADEENAILSMSEDVLRMITGEFVYNRTINGNGWEVSSDRLKTLGLFLQFQCTFLESIRNIIAKDNREYLHRIIIRHAEVAEGLGWIPESSITVYGQWKNEAKDALEDMRIEAYWQEHSQEKDDLLQKQKQLKSRLEALQDEYERNVHVVQAKRYEKEQSGLIAELDQLGIFKTKERRALRERLEALEESTACEWEQARSETKELSEEIDRLNEELEAVECRLRLEEASGGRRFDSRDKLVICPYCGTAQPIGGSMYCTSCGLCIKRAVQQIIGSC